VSVQGFFWADAMIDTLSPDVNRCLGQALQDA